MHPIDEAIAAMQTRRQARTWPPVSLAEFSELNDEALRSLAKEKGVKANDNRQKLIMALYRQTHALDQRMKL